MGWSPGSFRRRKLFDELSEEMHLHLEERVEHLVAEGLSPEEATPRDPVVLAGVVAGMALLGLLATWIPAQRALSVNPLVLLREE